MPKLVDTRKKIRIELPSYGKKDPAWIEAVDDLSVSDIVEIQDMPEGKARTMSLLSTIIADWNFTDNSNNKLPITADNVSKLRLSDIPELLSLLQKVGDTVSDKLEKKSSQAVGYSS